MEEVYHVQNSFNLGEISPRMGVRGDLQQYRNACETLRGWRCVPHGGIRTTFGTTYIAATKNSAHTSRLIPFKFNNEQTYAMEFGNEYIRFFSQGAVVGAPYEVSTPYAHADLPLLRYAQDNDLLYLAHPSYAPRVLTRTGAATFTLTTPSFTGGPFCSLTHSQYSGTGTGISMTAGASTVGATSLTAGAAFFTTDMVGQFIRLGTTVGTPPVQGYATITAFNSTTSVDITVVAALSATAVATDWALGAWGDETGYPSDVTFFQQRLVFASTTAEPQTFWGSKVGTSLVHTVGTSDNDAYTHTVAATDANKIQWIQGAVNTLLIGTSGEEYSAGGENDGALGPNNPFIFPETAFGSSTVKPVKAYKGVVYVQRGGRKLNHMTFSLQDDSYNSSDLLLLAEHLASTDAITELHFQLRRDPYIWAVQESGSLLSISWLPQQEVAGPSKHTFTNGEVKSMCILPSIDAQDDDIWMIMERTIDGNTVKYVELADETSPLGCNLTGAIGGKTITGLSHLEGEEVTIVGDGALYNSKTVASGSVTVDDAELEITNATVGLLTVPTCTTIEPEFETRTGTTYGRKKRYSKVKARVLDTLILEVNGEPVYVRDAEDIVEDVPPTPPIQDMSVVDLGYTAAGRVTITQPYPFHAHVLGVFGKLTVGD